MKSNDNIKKWFAFYTKSRHEKSVNNTLKNNGYEVYLPLLRERKNGATVKNGLNTHYLNLIYLSK